MFPLFVRSVGNLFSSPAARAAIEKVVQPRVNVALSTLTHAQWYQTVSAFFKENSWSIVTAITAVGATTDLVQLLNSNASSPEDKSEIVTIQDMLKSVSFPSTSGNRAKAGCSIDPYEVMKEVNEKRSELQEFANLHAIPVKSAIRLAELQMKIFSEFDSYKAISELR